MYGSNCKIADANGAHVLHGCRRVFHNDKEPAFRAIYAVFEAVSILFKVIFGYWKVAGKTLLEI